MQHRRLWLILGGIVLLGAAFLFLNFRVAASNTHTEKNITTAGIGEGLPGAMQRRDKISIALSGEGQLAGALQKALAVELKQAGIGEIELVQGLEPAYPNPVLVLKVSQPGLFWAPFFATSHFNVQAGYASNGDTTFMGKSPIAYDNSHGPALNMFAELKGSDRSWGLISRPGYYQLLADALAREIVAALKGIYQV